VHPFGEKARVSRRSILTGKPVDTKYQYAPGVAVQRAGLLFVSGMVGWDANGTVVGVGIRHVRRARLSRI
jgi:enamine deaminase RidA (YjgF/YER057c/UK114 family)